MPPTVGIRQLFNNLFSGYQTLGLCSTSALSSRQEFAGIGTWIPLRLRSAGDGEELYCRITAMLS